MVKRLELLTNSLQKKEKELSIAIENHLADTQSANGQPLNDKRNGASTMKRWDVQRRKITNLQESIEKTKKAIEAEEYKMSCILESKNTLPDVILKAIESGEIVQWRKHPNIFFVKGVDVARFKYEGGKVFAYNFSGLGADDYRVFARKFSEISQALRQVT